MKNIEYTNSGLVFIIEISVDSGAVFNAAKRVSIGFLHQLNEKEQRLFDFHESIEDEQYDFQGGPCSITIKNGGYDD